MIVTIILILVFSGISFFLGFYCKKLIVKAKIASAKEEAEHIVSDALKDAQARKKDIILQGKEEIIKLKTENDQELYEQRKVFSKREKRIREKEENLERRVSSLNIKDENVAKKMKLAEEKLNEIEELKSQQIKTLEEISGLSTEKAKKILFERFDGELNHEKSVKIKQIEE